MNTNTIRLSAVLLMFAASCAAEIDYSTADPGNVDIRGIYGHPGGFWDQGLRLNDLGVNAVFLHHGSITHEFVQRARAGDQHIFAEFATLNGKGYVDEHPEAWAIDETGNKVEPASWFMGVCPTEPGFFQFRLESLRTLLRQFEIDGVWMDYVHWHAQFEEPEPILPETCFCDHCLTTFQESTGIDLPDGATAAKAEWILTNVDSEWRNWRCSVIADWARSFRTVIEEERPGALLGVYHCPWADAEFDGARRRILGLDYDTLAPLVDVFSPMVYHGRMGRPAAWVGENIEWFSSSIERIDGNAPDIWPIVQAHNSPGVISAAEFEEVLRNGASGKTSGIMMFTSRSVAEDAKKTAVLKKVYSEWKKP